MVVSSGSRFFLFGLLSSVGFLAAHALFLDRLKNWLNLISVSSQIFSDVLDKFLQIRNGE